MKVPLNWLRDYLNVILPVEHLAERLTMSGIEVKGWEVVDDDFVLDLDVTPNRPDCLSVIGIAREVAALTEQELNLPQVRYEQEGVPIEQVASAAVADIGLCLRYCAGLVTGLNVSTSPAWLQQKLLACGMRPINNIVDITNYVMLEWGQPLHAFDYHRLEGNRIVVRRAQTGEVINTLDGVERELSNEMLVIADSRKPVAVAGVMGGADTEVRPGTTSVLLESATFKPNSVYHTAMDLRLHTEASLRFEKGLVPELTLIALERAMQLLLELAGGVAASGLIDVYPNRVERQQILLPIYYVKRLLGIEFEPDQIARVLGYLGFGFEPAGSTAEFRVTVPYWRGDVKLAADLVEEVARIAGYDKIPTTMLSSPLPRQQPEAMMTLRERIRDILIGCGFQEVITYSLTSKEMLDKVAPVPPPLRLANPMSREQEYLRTSLRAGLLSTLSYNQKHEEDGIRFFEVSSVYLPREGDLPEEREMLAGVLSGPRLGLSWLGERGPLDYFDAKGTVEALLNGLGARASFEVVEDKGLHPGRRAGILVDGDQVGIIGELHPKVREAFDLSGEVYLFEIEVAKLLPPTLRMPRYQFISRFPAIVRDLAIVVNAQLPSQRAQDIIQGFPLVEQVALFDLYTGQPVPQGQKSLAYRVVFQSPNHTLTEEEVDRVQEGVVDRLCRELGATLRSGDS